MQVDNDFFYYATFIISKCNNFFLEFFNKKYFQVPIQILNILEVLLFFIPLILL